MRGLDGTRQLCFGLNLTDVKKITIYYTNYQKHVSITIEASNIEEALKVAKSKGVNMDLIYNVYFN